LSRAGRTTTSTTPDGVARLFRDARPEVIFHLAAVVGGIGANRDNPGRFFYENAIMGIQLIEEARKPRRREAGCGRHHLLLSEARPGSLPRGDAVGRLPGGNQRALRHRQEGAAGAVPGYREQYGLNAILPAAGEPLRPARQLRPRNVARDPALIRKCLEAKARGESRIVCWGDGSPTREFLYVEDAAEGLIAGAEKYDKPEPVNLGSGEEISIRDLTPDCPPLRVRRRDRVGYDEAERPAAPAPRHHAGGREFGFRAMVPLEEGLAKNHRLGAFLEARSAA
jgi:GDP-L-fucose synthase